MTNKEAAEIIRDNAVPSFPLKVDIKMWEAAKDKAVEALEKPKYKEIEVNQAMQTANALKSLMCKTYCVNRVMVDRYEITKENFDNCCKNCPFAEIREVY